MRIARVIYFKASFELDKRRTAIKTNDDVRLEIYNQYRLQSVTLAQRCKTVTKNDYSFFFFFFALPLVQTQRKNRATVRKLNY